MANNLTVTYKGNTIHTASASGSATLETGGTWCEGDIGLSYSFDVAKATLAVAVTNGTATSVTATKSGTSVSLTYSGGIWSAELPSFGTWTVTITDGTHSNTASVIATQAGLYTVSIYMPDVPSAYTQLEYLQSDGNAYINTHWVPNSGFHQVAMELMYLDAAQDGVIFGGRRNGSGGANAFAFGVNYEVQATKMWQMISDHDWYEGTVGPSKNVKYSVIANFANGAQSLIVNGTTVISRSETMALNNMTEQALFGVIRGYSTDAATIARIWNCTIQTNNTPIRKMFPARRNADSVLGMYDTVRDLFHINVGTGAFIAGPAV